MTVRKQEQIAKSATLYYHAFPTEVHTENHTIIVKVCEILSRIQEYKNGAIRGSHALPQSLIGAKYSEFWDKLEEYRERIDKTAVAGKEALQAVEDAEDLLNWIFLGA